MAKEPDSNDSNGWNRARGLVVKSLILLGGALLVKRLSKSTTRWDHARIVSQSLAGEKVNHLPVSALFTDSCSLCVLCARQIIPFFMFVLNF